MTHIENDSYEDDLSFQMIHIKRYEWCECVLPVVNSAPLS